MDLRQIRCFLEVARQSNFTRAAAKLRIAQPAVSVSIRNLEDDLGVKLFNRKEKKIALTTEGEAFFNRAQAIEALVQTAELEMKELRGLERGEIQMGIPGMLAAHRFPEIIVEFIHRYPGLKLSVYSEGARKIEAMLMKGKIDVGIVAGHNLPEQLEYRSLLVEEMVACVAPNHQYAKRKAISLEEFSREPVLLFREGYYQRELLIERFEKQDLNLRPLFETNLVPLLKSLAAKGDAITTLLRVETEGKPRLVAVPFNPPLHIEAGIAWKKNAYLTNASRAFVDFLIDRFGANR